VTRLGLFLCGCDPVQKRNYNVTVTNDGVLTDRRFDDEGYEICPEHGVRLYGWASPSFQHPGGQTLLDWGKMGSRRELKLEPSGPDRRNFIDTISVGEERLARRAARTNGTPSERVQSKPAVEYFRPEDDHGA